MLKKYTKLNIRKSMKLDCMANKPMILPLKQRHLSAENITNGDI